MDYYRNFDLIYTSTQKPVLTGFQYYIEDDGQEIVTAEFFKQHARIDFATDDTLVASYIKAARQALEQWAQKSFNEKTVRFKAINMPDNYRLMFGPINEITVPADGFELFGDNVSPGGTDVEISYTTLGMADNDLVKVAICRYAAGLYMFRENIVETKFSATNEMDAAKEMLAPIRNVTWF